MINRKKLPSSYQFLNFVLLHIRFPVNSPTDDSSTDDSPTDNSPTDDSSTPIPLPQFLYPDSPTDNSPTPIPLPTIPLPTYPLPMIGFIIIIIGFDLTN